MRLSDSLCGVWERRINRRGAETQRKEKRGEERRGEERRKTCIRRDPMEAHRTSAEHNSAIPEAVSHQDGVGRATPKLRFVVIEFSSGKMKPHRARIELHRAAMKLHCARMKRNRAAMKLHPARMKCNRAAMKLHPARMKRNRVTMKPLKGGIGAPGYIRMCDRTRARRIPRVEIGHGCEKRANGAGA
uniref:Uncharacterized protein n=1 Tax=Candidatus Kentrum sp. FM TaxID=2126340 RepID=A0A450WAS4_9GAMM|nr:MAG: hypothetical protein BECKFM1743C_GA0114222_103102 [Candidatus Kentron sp. FM]VFJ62688.1 MAG: hypothetical protein BECKFM1743A_GA0114220_103132 [Candidatus Kentron sp. FM]VFK14108.1 MAG: hypothetical protein BECKFM1743B_GA0114221_103071 [Candidatus Kentron sp. FM]